MQYEMTFYQLKKVYHKYPTISSETKYSLFFFIMQFVHSSSADFFFFKDSCLKV